MNDFESNFRELIQAAVKDAPVEVDANDVGGLDDFVTDKVSETVKDEVKDYLKDELGDAVNEELDNIVDDKILTAVKNHDDIRDAVREIVQNELTHGNVEKLIETAVRKVLKDVFCHLLKMPLYPPVA